jgi:hypothetical protein
MRLRHIVPVAFLLLCGATVWLVLSRPGSGTHCQVTAHISAITNGPLGMQHATVRLMNIGHREAYLPPLWSLETRSGVTRRLVITNLIGRLASRVIALTPGESYSLTIEVLNVMVGLRMYVFCIYASECH